jgi:hypothetical protein
MPSITMTRRWLAPAVALAAALGCTRASDDGRPDFSKLVPVDGVVTLNGQPLAGAVVTFLPPRWGPGVGETDRDGKYTLKNAGHKGTPPGDYKVAISYLVSADGEPQGLGPRSGLVLPPSMLTATERLPREYSDLGRTKLTAKVGDRGGAFNFDVTAEVEVGATKGKDRGGAKEAGAEGSEEGPPPGPPG